jgi:hypothetical protein
LPVSSVARLPVVSGIGSVSFVPLEFLPSLPFRKQADFNIPHSANL